MSKVILVLIDGLGYEEAKAAAGYLEHLAEWELAAKYRVEGELPSLSRPMYETLLTGLPASEHGIATNLFTRPSRCENLFSLVKNTGLTGAAAAYHWISELYQRGVPREPRLERYQFDSPGLIRHGIFYAADNYPDLCLYNDADYLRRTYHPDFLLVHPSGCDYHGHLYGRGSREYRTAAAGSFDRLSALLSVWQEDGYDVVVTADHGMDELGVHAGNLPEQREVPLYILSKKVECGDFTDSMVSPLQTAPLCCALLGISPAAGMRPLTLRMKEN